MVGISAEKRFPGECERRENVWRAHRQWARHLTDCQRALKEESLSHRDKKALKPAPSQIGRNILQAP